MASTSSNSIEENEKEVNMIKAFDKEGNLLAQIEEDYTTVSMAKGQLSGDMMFATLSANNLVNLYKINKD